MEKFNDYAEDEEDYSNEQRNFEIKFFAGPPLKKISNLKRAGVESVS